MKRTSALSRLRGHDGASLSPAVPVPPFIHTAALNEGLDSVSFLSNARKGERERWIVDRWCTLRDVARELVVAGGDPPDFVFAGRGIEVVEVLPPGRKRHDEYKARVAALGRSTLPVPTLSLPLQVIREHGSSWITAAIRDKSETYGLTARTWTLVVYANFNWLEQVDWEEVRAAARSPRCRFAVVDVVRGSGSRLEQFEGVEA